MEFKKFKEAVQAQFNHMLQYDLFRVAIDREKIREVYLSSFPEGTNPMFRERTEHDCNCCHQFIRNSGMVAIVDDKLVSIWDITIDGFYQDVADELSAYTKSCCITNIFKHKEPTIGIDKSFEPGFTWEHFYVKLPAKLIGTADNDSPATRRVMQRGFEGITLHALDQVLELIADNDLYKGEENFYAVSTFKALLQLYNRSENKALFCWRTFGRVPESVSKIRGTSIGTLLISLSEGMDLDTAVAKYEKIVAPENYKRTSAPVSQRQREEASAYFEANNYTASIDRRYAKVEDMTVTNAVFVDRSIKSRMFNAFDAVPVKTGRTPSSIGEIPIEEFLGLSYGSLEFLFENRLTTNLVSMLTTCDPTAQSMFKWGNAFSWSYNGDFTDSLTERVKAAGGSVDGDFCNRLEWYNTDDLDLHMIEPSGYEIEFTNKGCLSPSHGMLDVDMNANSLTRTPVENIFYTDKCKMRHGIYALKVHNYNKREAIDIGFAVEIAFGGKIHRFTYDKPVKNNETIEVAKILYDDEFKITASLPSSTSSKEVWGIATEQFHKVTTVSLSPNFWTDTVGHKHFFFFLEGCVNAGTARGFYNEFLREEFTPYRKVLEILGSKLRTEESTNQLSGIGFSATKHDTFTVKVDGKILKVRI